MGGRARGGRARGGRARGGRASLTFGAQLRWFIDIGT